MHEAERYHDFSYGHKVTGHESKCRHLHGHNGRVTFYCLGAIDEVGRVIDFSTIKTLLCQWVEDNWDHRFLIWEQDPNAKALKEVDPKVVLVPFNPTAENMAQYLCTNIAPTQLRGTGITCHKVRFEETRKCSATYSL